MAHAWPPSADRPEGFVGTTVRTVRYRTLPNLDEERFVRFGDVHDVPMGIDLECQDGESYRIAWVKDGTVPRIDLASGSMWERFPGSTLPAVDVVDWAEWRTLVGRRLTDVATLAAKSCRQVGLRMGFDGGSAVTVMLGEADASGRPHWSEDNLVVIFERDVADTYLQTLGHSDGWLSVAG